MCDETRGWNGHGLDGVEGDFEGLEKDVWRIDDGSERDKLNKRGASWQGIRKTENTGA